MFILNRACARARTRVTRAISTRYDQLRPEPLANCGSRATEISMKLLIAAASSAARRVSASVRTRIHPAGAPGHHWGRVGTCPQRDARASGGVRN